MSGSCVVRVKLPKFMLMLKETCNDGGGGGFFVTVCVCVQDVIHAF